MTREDKDDSTRERLLNEGESLFARKGYDAVSVREITTAAECNLAAVNYHFDNKRNLYLEVFRARWVPRAKRLRECFERSLAAQHPLSPAAVVRALAQAFLEGPLTEDERLRHGQLMAREVAQPTKAFDHVAEHIMRPFFKKLAETLGSLLPVKLEEERMMLNILSILGMVLYFNFARVAVSRMTGREYDSAFKARLVEHIIEFSLNGLKGSIG